MRRLALLLALPLIAPAAAEARGYRIDQVPGGYHFDCYMCHFRQPFRRLTVFGEQVRANLLFREDYPDPLPENFYVGDEGNVDWPTVALLDADGDGYTNGEELGDPLGAFVQLGPQPDFPFTRPDLADDFPCGSGTVEGPEACDGDDLGGLACPDFGWPGGVLRCADDCAPDPSGCTPCGDGVLDPGEACDGPVDRACPDGLVGEVRCVACAIDESGCVPPPPDVGVDAAVVDAVVVDAEVPDAEVLDAEVVDAEVVDAAPLDATPLDATPLDTAMTDADLPDAALDPPDAGPRPLADPRAPATCAQRPGGADPPGWPFAALLAALARAARAPRRRTG